MLQLQLRAGWVLSASQGAGGEGQAMANWQTAGEEFWCPATRVHEELAMGSQVQDQIHRGPIKRLG